MSDGSPDACMPTAAPAADEPSRRRKRVRLLAPYPGVEETSMGRTIGGWGLLRAVAFIVTSAALLWALIFWAAGKLL